jgi:hypothetical protein
MRVEPAAVTVWDGQVCCPFIPAELCVDAQKRARLLALASSSPIWIDMALAADPLLWLEPWDGMEPENVDWSAMRELARLLGFALPAGDQPSTDPAVTALNRLPVLNELAVLRWLTDELKTCAGASAFPLVGLIPVSTLSPRRPDAPQALDGKLAFVLLRVNAAVVGRFVFTIRLPDRLCVAVGGGARAGRRIAADYDAFEAPDLTCFRRYLPPGRPGQAEDVAAAVGIYLSATCGAAAEHARERLFEIERALVELPTVSDGQDATALVALCQDVFQTRGALQTADEELLRVVQRQAEVNAAGDDDPLVATRKHYEQGLEEMRCVQRDLRAIGDAVTARIASSQVHIVQQAEERSRECQTHLQGLVGLLGTALVVPALVATLFSDSVRLPHPKPVTGLIAMLAVMVVSALGVWWLLNRRSGQGASPETVSWPARPRSGDHELGRGRPGVAVRSHEPA